jgi:hypothetical protein
MTHPTTTEDALRATHADSALDGAIYMMLGHGCAVDASQIAAAASSL